MSGTIDDLETLANRVSGLTAARAERDAVIAGLRDLVVALRGTVAVQAGRIAELERRLGLSSSNSGKPPSSDGLSDGKPLPARLADLIGRRYAASWPTASLARVPAAAGAAGKAGAEEAATGSQPRPAAAGQPGRGAAVHPRSRRSRDQQRGRTGAAPPQGPAEDLRQLP